MSRRINLQRPLTEEEKEYLLTRANGADLIKINERQFEGLEEKQKVEARETAARDEQFEARHNEDDDDDEDGYHPDDMAQVVDLTVAEMRQRLSKEGLPTTVSSKEQVIEGSDRKLTEKEVLAYRLLDHLDSKRNG